MNQMFTNQINQILLRDLISCGNNENININMIEIMAGKQAFNPFNVVKD